MNGAKASKSLGNVVYLSDITERGFHPLTLRYFFLQAHYRTPLSFSWDALAGASSALERLWKLSLEIGEESKRVSEPSEARDRFLITLRDDLATSQALGVIWDALRSEEYTSEEKWGLIETADAHLGLSLIHPPLSAGLMSAEIPADIQNMLADRERARSAKDFAEADRLRALIENSGYRVDDGPSGAVLTRTTL